MTSFLMGYLSWVVSLAQELGGWEHNHFIVEKPSVRFEYKVPLLVFYVFLDPISVSPAHLSYKPSCLSLLALWDWNYTDLLRMVILITITIIIIDFPSDSCH